MAIGQVENLQRGYKGTEKTIERMHKLVVAGKLDPEMQRIATWLRMGIGGDKRGKSPKLAEAIFNWTKRHGIFQRDPLQIEKIETPAEAMRPVIEMRKAGAYSGPGLFVGDCDTFTIMVATLGGILGYEYSFETVKLDPRRPKEFSHIYAALLVDGKWIPLDASSPIGFPGWRPSVPENKLHRWREPIIEKTVKKMKLNGKHKRNGRGSGMGAWVPPKPGWLPYDYQGYGIPKNFPGRPQVPHVDPGEWGVQIPQEPATPRAQLDAGSEMYYTKRVPTPSPSSRIPVDERDFTTAPQYMPKRPYISEMTPYPQGWPYSRQEVLVMDQPFKMSHAASKKFAVASGEVIPIAGYDGVEDVWLDGSMGQGETVLQTDAAKAAAEKLAAEKEAAAKVTIGGSIEAALKGLIAAVPGMTSDYYAKKKLEMEARVAEAAAKTANIEKQTLLARMGIGFDAPWYANPLTWVGIAAAAVGGYFLIVKPMMGGGRKRNPPRRRKSRGRRSRKVYRMRSPRRRRAAA